MTQLPNVITILRVAGSFILLFFDVTDVVLWCLYCLCGFSDIIDGFLARKFKCATKTGALLTAWQTSASWGAALGNYCHC